MKPVACSICRTIVVFEADLYERREELILANHTGKRIGVRRIELPCSKCARELSYRWKGFDRRQSALFSAEDGTMFVKEDK